jgi:transcriptional regulator with XRE-family HTH domain
MKRSQKTIGKLIRKCRDAANMTQKQLAVRTKLTANYICLMEADRKAPSLEAANRIAVALGVPLSELISEDYVIKEIRNKIDLPAAAKVVAELDALVRRLAEQLSKC